MFHPTALSGVVEIRPKRFSDDRGYLFEAWSAEAYADAGLPSVFVQDNVSFSPHTGTVRGLHYQKPPYGQAKLVSCLAGRIFDVAVDLRPRSRTRGHWIGVELDAKQGNQLFVPEGFAHGFCTLDQDCLVAYKLSAPYRPGAEAALRFDDPALDIAWPVSRQDITMSAKDREAAPLASALADWEAYV